ncbi:MAG: hypothetical protein U5K30_05125 [Acidimicrobiales bacterium]|nr:hypothetical protein [Acidimicrobiales bacterium]
MRTTVAAAAMAGALTVGAGTGAALFAPDLVNAQTVDTTESTEAQRPEPGQRLTDALAPLVDDGTITQEQADAVVAAIEEARPERMRGPGHRFPILEDVIGVLGIGAEELRDAIADGRTLAEIAEANGVEIQAVVEALVETYEERIDRAVEDGRLTEDEAAEKRADATERAEAVVDGEVELGGPRHGRDGHHGPGGRFGPGDDLPDDADGRSSDTEDETTGS